MVIVKETCSEINTRVSVKCLWTIQAGQAATGGLEEARLLAVRGGAGVQSMRPRVTVKFAHLEKTWWRSG